MARKLTKSGFVTIAQLARKLGVSGQAVSQAIRSGRLVAMMAVASVFRRGSPAENGYVRSWLPRIGTTGASDTMTRRLRMTLWPSGPEWRVSKPSFCRCASAASMATQFQKLRPVL
jgi:hypothetical protein